MTTFGDWLNEQIEELRISKSELARIAGLSPVTVVEICNGDIKRPSEYTMDRLEKAVFDCSTGEVKYTVRNPAKKKIEALQSGEMPRFLVAGIHRQRHQWEVIGVFSTYADACSVASYYLPRFEISSEFVDVFVWKETDF